MPATPTSVPEGTAEGCGTVLECYARFFAHRKMFAKPVDFRDARKYLMSMSSDA